MSIFAQATASQRRRSRDIAKYVRDDPVTALATAAAAGFILGGGVTRRIGLMMLTIAGRIALHSMATRLIVGIGTDRHDNERQDSASPGSEKHDHGRRASSNPR